MTPAFEEGNVKEMGMQNLLDPSLSASPRSPLWRQLHITGGTVVKNLPASEADAEDLGSIPGLGRSPGEGNGTPLQYSCLENHMDKATMGSQRVGHD